MKIKNTSVDGKIVDVISEEEYCSKYQMYQDNPAIASSTAVEINSNGKSYILPFRTKTDDRPGIYPEGCIYFTKVGEDYNYNNFNVIDFSDTSTIQDFINKNAAVRQMETDILTDVDSLFAPAPAPNDSPEMVAFKEAICSKRIDINKYAPRFGDNFLNDKRILRSNSITLNKLVSMCEKLDIEAELSLRDVKEDIANPMKKEIKVILTTRGDEE